MQPELLSLQGARVLVVDDQEDSRLLISELLKDECAVSVASSGDEALDLCEHSPPDLILLDVLMDGMDGLRVCREIKRNPEFREIPIIFITSSLDTEMENACWKAGAIDFINKPINANSLRNRVKAQLSLKLQSDFIRNLAFIDGLTGIFNRTYLESYLARQIKHAIRSKASMGVVILDVDFFKAFNDTFGHLEGDECLRRVAGSLKSGIYRPLDIVARYGGEEFVVVLPETDAHGLETVVKRLVSGIEALGIATDSSPFGRVTISAGATLFRGDTDTGNPSEFLDRADKALYKAKSAGRNRYLIR